MFERINIEALKPGMVIVQVTKQNGPVRIRKSGLVTSDAMVTGLREMGVLELEVDPEQTVEIQSDDVQSQTQFLLQSNSTQSGERSGDQASTRQDSQLAEQFNRSLFLPTAQDIPDTWQVYTRRFGTAAAVILLGFGLGFGAAVGPEMWSEIWSEIRADSNTDTQIASNANRQKEPDHNELNQIEPTVEGEAATIANADEVVKAATEQESIAANPTDKAAQPNAEVDNPSVTEVAEPQEAEMLVLGLQPQDDVVTASGGRGLSQNREVSQALLEKFQKVMSEMEQQQRDQPFVASQAPDVPEPTDVPRVDQMPQWVLSSLPRLSFNAHMFATDSADRWVKVNGKELGEGDWIDAQLRIQRIDPQHIILDFQGNEFSMKALSDW